MDNNCIVYLYDYHHLVENSIIKIDKKIKEYKSSKNPDILNVVTNEINNTILNINLMEIELSDLKNKENIFEWNEIIKKLTNKINSLKKAINEPKEDSIIQILDFQISSENYSIKEDETIYNIDSSGNTIHILSNGKEININENNEENICMVCFDEINKEDLENYKIECGHKFCKECWLNYLEEKIKSNEDILCMEKTCLKKINEDIIRYFIKDNNILIKKYENYVLKRKIYNNSNMKFCPFPDCDGFGIIKNLNNPNNKFIKCSNGHEFCFVCLKKWHKGKKCKEEVLDKNLKKLKNEINSKRCPNCGILLIKYTGCNHITCSNCKYEFCWICMNKYTYEHFKTSGCFEYKQWKICEIKIIRYIYNFFYSIIIYLLYCLLSFPIFLLRSVNMMRRYKKFLSFIIYFPLFVIYEILFFCLMFIFLLTTIFNNNIFTNFIDYHEELFYFYRNLLGY